MCGHCGSLHDRDENAAKNTELEGIALLAGSGYVGVTPVELWTSTLVVRNESKPRAMKQERTGVAHFCTPER